MVRCFRAPYGGDARVAMDVVTTTRAAARGLVAAMAMTGTRVVTKNLGLLVDAPPDAIVKGRAAKLVERLGPRGRDVATELAHWGYGAVGGAAFGLLPDAMRRHASAGALYGLAIWLAFEAAVAPVFGVQYVREQGKAARASLLADHLLYGVVVAGQLAPEQARERRLSRLV